MGGSIELNTGMGLVGGIPSDITIADNTFVDVSPRPRGPVIGARAHNALGQDGVPPIERLIITGNTFIRSGGPALALTGIKASRIENNRFESPVRATVIARPATEIDRQAIMLRHSTGVELKANTLDDPTHQTRSCSRADARSRRDEEITLDGRHLDDAPKRDTKTK